MRTLIQLSFVVDLDSLDEVAELVSGMEENAGGELLRVLKSHGVTWEDVSDRLLFFGVSAIPARDSVGDSLV